MNDLTEAWKYFIWLEAIGWRVLPNAGGLADQDEMLMENIFAIKNFINKVKEAKKNGQRS